MNKRKILIILNIIGLLFCILGIFIFTILFKINSSIFRYLFLFCILILFGFISFILDCLESNIQKPVKKYSMVNIDNKYINKLDNNKKKLFFKF